jgi:hypothetical protein
MKKVLLTMLTTVLMCCACTSGTSDEASGTDEEKRYDAMLRKTQWEKIVEEAA